MDIAKLKKLMKTLGAILVMDGENPSFVVLSYEKFEELDAENGQKARTNDVEMTSAGYDVGPDAETAIYKNPEEEILEDDRVNKLNEEIAFLRNEIRQREAREPEDELPPID